MQALIFDTLAEAQTVSAQLNTYFGFPKVGTLYGGGIHADSSELITGYQTIFKHPVNEQWALLVDAASMKVLGRNDDQTLTSGWFGTPIT